VGQINHVVATSNCSTTFFQYICDTRKNKIKKSDPTIARDYAIVFNICVTFFDLFVCSRCIVNFSENASTQNTQHRSQRKPKKANRGAGPRLLSTASSLYFFNSRRKKIIRDFVISPLICRQFEESILKL